MYNKGIDEQMLTGSLQLCMSLHGAAVRLMGGEVGTGKLLVSILEAVGTSVEDAAMEFEQLKHLITFSTYVSEHTCFGSVRNWPSTL